jgi:coproporphyrinogen III oxidase
MKMYTKHVESTAVITSLQCTIGEERDITEFHMTARHITTRGTENKYPDTWIWSTETFFNNPKTDDHCDI